MQWIAHCPIQGEEMTDEEHIRELEDIIHRMEERERDANACIFMCTVGALFSMILSVAVLIYG